MPEERKPTPLPPLPWSTQNEPRYDDATWVLDADGHTIAECYGLNAQTLAELLLRAPALESELHAAREQARFALDFLNERDSARALLRELAAAVKERDEAWIECDNDPRPETWSRRDSTDEHLEAVLRRVEAEAGEENANG